MNCNASCVKLIGKFTKDPKDLIRKKNPEAYTHSRTALPPGHLVTLTATLYTHNNIFNFFMFEFFSLLLLVYFFISSSSGLRAKTIVQS